MKQLTQAIFDGQPKTIQSASVNDRGHVWLHESWFYYMTFDDDLGAWKDKQGDFGLPKGSDYDGSEPKCIARLGVETVR